MTPFRVFISSTAEDLAAYIAVAREVFANHEGLICDQFQRWPSTGRLPVSLCKERVIESDAVVVIAGFRYGWIPLPEEDGDGIRSITRIEVETARLHTKPLQPFVIVRTDGLDGVEETDPQRRALLDEFRSSLLKTACRTVESPESFRIALIDSLPYLRERLLSQEEAGASRRFFAFGKPVQGIGDSFRDRTTIQKDIYDALGSERYRGVCIVGKGGWGKSALANHAIDHLCESGIRGVIYLSAEGGEAITLYNLFKGTMEAVGKDPMSYEASWRGLSENMPELINRLLDCFRAHRILINFDGFEAKLNARGAIEDEGLSKMLSAFLTEPHQSRLLVTSRMPVKVSLHADRFLLPMPLDEGLPVKDAEELVRELAAGRFDLDEKELRKFVESVAGVPFLLERLYDLFTENYVLDLEGVEVREDMLEELVKRVQSRLSDNAKTVLQALSIFDEAVGLEAINFVLIPLLPEAAIRAGLEEVVRARLSFRVAGSQKYSLHRLDKEASYNSIADNRNYNYETLHRRAAGYYDRGCENRAYWYQWTSYDELEACLRKFQQLRKAGDDAGAALSMSISKVEFLNWSGHVRDVQDMFRDLKLDLSTPEALLIKSYALADALVLLGPYDKAVKEFEPVIELAHQLKDSTTEAAALYETGLAARYSGDGAKSLQLITRALESIRQTADEERIAYYLYGYSLACTYAGDYVEAIRSGLVQSDFGRKVRNPYFIGRGDSSLCLPLYVIGLARPAAERARHSADAFRVRHRYHLGFIENVLGLALLELGDVKVARNTFQQARKSAAAEIQPRVEGLATFNLAWLSYTEGKLAEAEEFAEIAAASLGPSDNPAVDLLRKAMAAATAKDHEGEARFLLKLAREETSNLDLVRRTTIAQRARAIAPVGSATETDAISYLTKANETFSDIVNQLGPEVMNDLHKV